MGEGCGGGGSNSWECRSSRLLLLNKKKEHDITRFANMWVFCNVQNDSQISMILATCLFRFAKDEYLLQFANKLS